MKVRTRKAKRRLVQSTTNAFCPTGPGGGQDNSCSPSSGSNPPLGKYLLRDERVSTPELADKEFMRALRIQYPRGVPLYHESPASALESIKKNGLTSSDSAESTNFATVGEPSGFLSGDKVIVKFVVPLSEVDRLRPDMRYDPSNPSKSLLKEHRGTFGADVAYDGAISPSRIEIVRLVQNWCNQHGGTTCRLSEWAVGKLQTSYAKFSARYGKKGAIAIMAAMAATMPIPGNILAVLGVAEGVRAVATRITGNASINDIVEDVRDLAEQLGLDFDEESFVEAYQREITTNESRIDMPQIRKEHFEDFLDYIKQRTTLDYEDAVDPHDLNAIQSEYSQERVDAIPDEKLEWPILVSKEGYVLDGNHRWIKAGQKGVTIPVLRIGLGSDAALELTREFPQSQFVANWCNQYGGDTCKDGRGSTKSDKTTKAKAKSARTRPAVEGVQLSKTDIRSVEESAERYLKSLPPDVSESVIEYTDEVYVELNAEMRSCTPKYDCLSRSNKKHLNNLEKAIAGHPRFEKPILVRRGMSLPRKQAKEFLDKLRGSVSKLFTFPSFTSTSMGKSFTGSVRFSITAKHGLPVGNYSENPAENEVILSPRSRYRVSKVEGNTVHLEQL